MACVCLADCIGVRSCVHAWIHAGACGLARRSRSLAVALPPPRPCKGPIGVDDLFSVQHVSLVDGLLISFTCNDMILLAFAYYRVYRWWVAAAN